MGVVPMPGVQLDERVLSSYRQISESEAQANIPKAVYKTFKSVTEIADAVYNPKGADENRGFGTAIFFDSRDAPRVRDRFTMVDYPARSLDQYIGQEIYASDALLDAHTAPQNMDGGFVVDRDARVLAHSQEANKVDRAEILHLEHRPQGGTRTSAATWHSMRHGEWGILGSSNGPVYLVHEGIIVSEAHPGERPTWYAMPDEMPIVEATQYEVA